MKKFLAIAAAALLAVSCGDDDSSSTNSPLVGTWKLTSLTTDDALDVNEDGVESTNFMAETGCFDETEIVFNNNGVAEMTMNYYFLDCYEATAPANWSLDGSTVTFTFDAGDGEETMTATVQGNTLTMYDDEFYEFEYEQNGEWMSTSIPATFVFTKQ